MDSTHTGRIELDGQPLDPSLTRVPGLLGYGHFTSMRVENARVRGLGLHMDRLEAATAELFGRPFDRQALRASLRRVAGDEAGASWVRVDVFSSGLDRGHPGRSVEPNLLVAAVPARDAAVSPIRVGSVRYQRELPHVKHAGTFGLFHQRRLAQSRGFDDALFVDATGAVSEGPFWNIGFFDGTRFVWPDAPALCGVSMQLLQAGLRERGVAQLTRRIGVDDVGSFRAAFVMNAAHPVRPVTSIDGVDYSTDGEPFLLLREVIEQMPWEEI